VSQVKTVVRITSKQLINEKHQNPCNYRPPAHNPGVHRRFGWGAACPPPTADALVNKLVQKGILTDQEGKDIMAESTLTNLTSASKWKISDAVKNIQLFGDLRMRYEYRGAENARPGREITTAPIIASGFATLSVSASRASCMTISITGCVWKPLHPRSPWVTFADDTANKGNSNFGTPSAKNSDTIGVARPILDGSRPIGSR